MRTLASLLLLTVLGAGPLPAQSRLFSGYFQNVPLWTHETDLVPGGVSDFSRFRVASERAFGAFTYEIAYEHVLTLRERESEGIFIGSVPSGGEWLHLQWTIEESEHVLWQHRFDRLNVGFNPTSAVAIELGRQTVSWATTLFLTPADPFSPFDPADPFREFRAGVDAARIRIYPGPLSELDVVVRPTKTEVGKEWTALGRGLVTLSGWELSGWAGLLYDEIAGAGALAGSLGAWAVRGEAVVRQVDEDTVFRGVVGVDRRFGVSGRDLFVVLEFQHDGLGASRPDDYRALTESDPYRRGELQVLGRDEAVLQASYQIHPLWGVSGLVLWNVSDGSALISPSFSYSASDEATVSGGVFFGLGDDAPTPSKPLPSEYGLLSAAAYFSVSVFF